VAGYGNLVDKVGNSNADNPNYTPVLYDPIAPAGQRFTTMGMPTSTIPRLYHSVATLVPSGKIMIAGSNPNKDFATNKYPTEYRVEWLIPPYLNDRSRPVISEFPRIANYKDKIKVKLGGTGKDLSKERVEAVLLDLGFGETFFDNPSLSHQNLQLMSSLICFDSNTFGSYGLSSSQVGNRS
jgi:hypothetical protein